MKQEDQNKYKQTKKGKETERVYRLKNRSKIREYHKEWVKKNKNKVKINKKMKCLLCEKNQASGMIHELDLGNKFICSSCDRNKIFINKHSKRSTTNI